MDKEVYLTKVKKLKGDLADRDQALVQTEFKLRKCEKKLDQISNEYDTVVKYAEQLDTHVKIKTENFHSHSQKLQQQSQNWSDKQQQEFELKLLAL